jgi:proteasome lid subunit RPN8/RPN11
MKQIPPLQIHQEHWDLMLADVSTRSPEEACGILAGTNWKSKIVFPVENILHSPTRFRMDPSRQLEIFLSLEELDLKMLGIYHSHPHGPAVPSPIDVAEAYYPRALSLIWSPKGDTWQCLGYKIQNHQVDEIHIMVIA